MKLSLKSISLLGLMLAAGSASATQCPDLNVTVINRSTQTISGVLQGTTGNLGSSGFGLSAGQSQVVSVYAQNYPQGTTFRLNGNIQWFGQTYEYQNCYGIVPGLNGCPNPNAQATMTLMPTGSMAICSIRVQALPPPPPTPVSINYEFINNVPLGTLLTATVGVTATYHGNPITITQNVARGATVKGQIVIPPNSTSVYVAGLGQYSGLNGSGQSSCGPIQFSNISGKTYVISFSNSNASCTVQQN